MTCAILSDDDAETERLIAAMRPADWSDFLSTVIERHRIAPAIADAIDLTTFPEATREALSAAVRRNAMDTLQHVAETRRIDKALRAEGVRPVFLKGWLLAEKLFGNAAARQARDLDLLVAEAERSQAISALQDLGYQPEESHSDRYLDRTQEVVSAELNNLAFRHAATGMLVEVHWRSHQFAGWPDILADPDQHCAFRSSAGEFLIPNDRANLIYLSVHGSLHRWSRLKWLHDIAQIAGQRGSDRLIEDLAAANELGVGRAVRLALDLSHHVLGSPNAWEPKASPWLVARCLEEIASESANPTGLRQRMKFYAMTLSLAQGWRQKAGVLRYRIWGKPRIALASLGRPV